MHIGYFLWNNRILYNSLLNFSLHFTRYRRRFGRMSSNKRNPIEFYLELSPYTSSSQDYYCR